jgi:hypothetical protein
MRVPKPQQTKQSRIASLEQTRVSPYPTVFIIIKGSLRMTATKNTE